MQHRFARVALPLKAVADRIALGSLIILSLLLLLLSRSDIGLVNEAGRRVSDAIVPLVGTLNDPVVSVRETISNFGELLAVHDENQRLREENRRLMMWQAEAVRLRVQNQSLRELLQMPERRTRSVWTTARVVADTGGPFVQARLIDAGSSRDVVKGMAVINEDGMVGRVVDVGEASARILLITDLNSRIPVIVEGSRDRAILEGDNSALPRLRFLPLDPKFRLGDRVLTSGEGGLLPPGLLIGEIAETQRGTVRVSPFVDWSRMDYVTVLNREPVLGPHVHGE